MNLRAYRKEFPVLEYWVYLNAADQAPPGRYWIDAMRECLTLYEAGRVSDTAPYDPATHPFLTPVFFECIKRAARLLHAKEAEVTNIYRVMTHANLIINDLIKWERGDNVVFSDIDYPSIPYILLGLRRKGVELRRIKSVNSEVRLSDLERVVDDKTKLVVINRTTPWCGFTHDVKEVVRIAHEHGAYVLDDAFQAAGAIDIDIHRDGVDFLLTGSYKWLLGPEGAGVLYVREDLIEELEPSFRNYIWADVPTGIPFGRPDHDNIKHWDYPLVKNANRYDLGICVTPILFGWNATLEFLEQVGIENIEGRVRQLGNYCINRLYEIGVKVVTPEDPRKRHGLIVYTTGKYKLDLKSYERLNNTPPGEKPVKVSLRYVGGLGGIRVSCHFFNTEEEVDKLVEIQKNVLQEEGVNT
ncbi:MAG: aminotransferase class V-fold PLP-dependent enzyme [Desulfurococcales archaeon]|nr:aminotransferase class V-fold PLP-dependent enzyme [Desulfurococcales archaeon]